LYHDKDIYTIEVELPGVHKKDIELEASENGFCLTAPREDIEYIGCWILATPLSLKGERYILQWTLKVTVPLVESFEGVKVPIK